MFAWSPRRAEACEKNLNPGCGLFLSKANLGAPADSISIKISMVPLYICKVQREVELIKTIITDEV